MGGEVRRRDLAGAALRGGATVATGVKLGERAGLGTRVGRVLARAVWERLKEIIFSLTTLGLALFSSWLIERRGAQC